MRKFLYYTFGVVIFLLYSFTSYCQTWNALNPSLNVFNNTIYTMDISPLGSIYAAGDFVDSNNFRFVVAWDGHKWSELGKGNASLKANYSITTLANAGTNVYAAGGFVNDSGQNYIAKWNGVSWGELRNNTSALRANGWIYSILTDKAGNVYAAGGFTNNMGKNYVAKWDGNSWQELGSGTNALNANDAIFSITSDSSGNLYAGGYFTNSSGKAYVAKWNGSKWIETGIGAKSLNVDGSISCLACDKVGNVYAGGDFIDQNGNYYVAKWNGSSWVKLGNGVNGLLTNFSVQAITVKSPTEIYAGGTDVERWNGTSWTIVNSDEKPLADNGMILCLKLGANGHVFAGGKFTNNTGHEYVAEWNEKDWKEPGDKGDPYYIDKPLQRILADSMGNTYVFGNYQDIGGASYFKYWNNKSWTNIYPQISPDLNINTYINGMAMDPKGNVYLGGNFVDEAGNNYIAKWDGKIWSKLEDYPNSLRSSYIGDVQTDKLGNVYAFGSFEDSVVGLVSLAKWDGKTWTRLSGSYGGVGRFCVTDDGNVYAYGSFGGSTNYYIANYNTLNEKWVEVKNPDSSRFTVPGANVFESLAIDSKNNLYVNGSFYNKEGKRYVAKWDGKNWSELGTTSKLNGNFVIDPSDNIYSTIPTNSTECVVRKWSGTEWVALPSDLNYGNPVPFGDILATDPNGNIYSNAYFQNKFAFNNFIARFGSSNIPNPKIISFTPSSGFLGSEINISGKYFSGTNSVNFGGVPASSFTVKNDSTINAIVGDGASGSVFVETSIGSDSLNKFTYGCDSIYNLIPSISSIGDSILLSTKANFYRWYLNNKLLENQNTGSIKINKTGFYRVETSPNNYCWASSFDYPIVVYFGPLADTLKMSIYPNPSGGQFTVNVKLSQTTSVITYVSIHDVSGNQILQTNKLIFFGKEIKIPVKINTKGTFFVKVYVNGDSKEQTVIIL
ncbi:MAG: T9SS type A sorting domain-containing protein [Ginsengibacter sp.]